MKLCYFSVRSTRGPLVELVIRRMTVQITYKDLHFAVQAVVQDQVMSHANAMRLHWMPLPIVIIADFRCGS